MFASADPVASLSLPCYTQLVPEATIVSIFATSFLVALGAVVTPGPLLALTIGKTAPSWLLGWATVYLRARHPGVGAGNWSGIGA